VAIYQASCQQPKQRPALDRPLNGQRQPAVSSNGYTAITAMTKTEFLELYGRHVYDVRLSAAQSLLTKYGPDDAITLADQFVSRLLSESVSQALDFVDT